jgi:hypothetical protein
MNKKKSVASLLLLLVAASTFGQSAKPTKAQTIEYIQSNYPRGFVYSAQEDSAAGLLTYHGEISDLAFGVTGSRVTVNYLDVLRVSNIGPGVSTAEEVKRERTFISFDLKDIEAIEGLSDWTVGYVSYTDADSGAFVVYLVFNAAGGKPAISVTKNGESSQVPQVLVPFTVDIVADNHRVMNGLKNSQLYKAVEHLRKLSGAPEPVRF